jgi:hypothetical protein
MLPCPVCTASVKEQNLPAHLTSKHSGAGPPAMPWRDRRRLSLARLEVDGDELRLRTRLGFSRRAKLTAPVVVAGLTRNRALSPTASYADERAGVVPGTERAGLSIAVGGIVAGCARSTDLRKHWAGFTDGKKRSRVHIALDPPAFVALQYALAEHGLLRSR